ncbi:TPA: PucR family transcriptional regulator [Enterococcus faecalis]|uniref:PucR family transcriptional regulator ligand-binding domain-containing protein n=1 Tax=Enterococcus faecalis TaxID=1351 RepID=A0ABD7XMB1_ENTFL|nr:MULTISPECIES: PucR family transcriptional regulator [Enterococcus]MBU5560464.1 PucR family transcriptional regulator ligand-binding domain-containing protein [Enterococcus sp. S115_ASV_20]MBU5577469.1 PucR family transcriptional regulator ligand-binding domain-containing protein [Enterococcus sp. S131_ASV_20]CPW54182.1 sugar diacid utilization regulator [Mycobacteroides abscessus]EIB6819945.1 PucR family transcriptional regulator ligand-binding domain-containing protein [Enterococcus faecali
MKILAEVLALPRFSDLQLLSSHSNLTQPLESVEITETPDVADFIPKNVMILTTAMIYKDDQEKLKPFIDSLKQAECTALGIKVGRFLDEISPEIVAYASAVDLPLIKIPSTQPLGGLLHEKIVGYLRDSKTEQMSVAFDIQKRFSTLLMQDVDATRFIAEFAKILNAPIILLSPWQQVIAHSNYFYGNQKSAEFFIEQLSKDHFQQLAQEKKIFRLQDERQENIQVAGFPIRVNDYFPYYLLVLSPEQIPYPISEFAIDQAILVLTFMLFKNQKIAESFEHLKTDFLDRLLDTHQEALSKHQNWLELWKNYRLINSDYYQLAIVYGVTKPENETHIRYQQAEGQLIFQWLKEQLPEILPDVALFKLKNQNKSILIFQSKKNDHLMILQNLAERLQQALPITIRFALGNAYENLEDLPNSYIEASSTLEASLHAQKPATVQLFHPKGLAGLFEKIGTEDVEYFCQQQLKELAYPTEPTLQELRKTLKVFLDFNCEITKTANALYLHRNTIKYRMNQCEKLLGTSIQEPETSLLLRVALELSEK